MRFVIPDLEDPMKYPKAVRRAVAQRQEAVRKAFQEHRERIYPLLPPPLQRLQDADVHDAIIRSLRIDPGAKTLQLHLLCYEESGYCDLHLYYREIQLTPQETSLLCFIAYHEDAEIYWQEIDWEGDAASPVFIHRILWQTRVQTDREPAEGLPAVAYTLQPEVELRFGALEIEVTPNPEGDSSRPDNFIQVVRDPDETKNNISRYYLMG